MPRRIAPVWNSITDPRGQPNDKTLGIAAPDGLANDDPQVPVLFGFSGLGIGFLVQASLFARLVLQQSLLAVIIIPGTRTTFDDSRQQFAVGSPSPVRHRCDKHLP